VSNTVASVGATCRTSRNMALSGALEPTRCPHCAFLFAGYLILNHGNVNWDVLQYVLVAIVGLAPVVTYSTSKLLWLAFDLMLRPVTSEELHWHRSERDAFSTGHNARNA
jgi:hypothetical protein